MGLDSCSWLIWGSLSDRSAMCAFSETELLCVFIKYAISAAQGVGADWLITK